MISQMRMCCKKQPTLLMKSITMLFALPKFNPIKHREMTPSLLRVRLNGQVDVAQRYCPCTPARQSSSWPSYDKINPCVVRFPWSHRHARLLFCIYKNVI
jgi:hypothetical protein